MPIMGETANTIYMLVCRPFAEGGNNTVHGKPYISMFMVYSLASAFYQASL